MRFPSPNPVGFLCGTQQWHGSRKKGRERQGWGSNTPCAVSNTNTYFCSVSFYFISMVELDTDDKGPLGPSCVPAAARPQSPQLCPWSIPAGGVASCLVALRPGSRWPSSLGLAVAAEVGWWRRALSQPVLAPDGTSQGWDGGGWDSHGALLLKCPAFPPCWSWRGCWRVLGQGQEPRLVGQLWALMQRHPVPQQQGRR